MEVLHIALVFPSRDLDELGTLVKKVVEEVGGNPESMKISRVSVSVLVPEAENPDEKIKALDLDIRSKVRISY
jgi:hypothetical protein